MTWTTQNPRNWHRWFAWYPVRVFIPYTANQTDHPPLTYHWLVFVERSSYGRGSLGEQLWNYRPVNPAT